MLLGLFFSIISLSAQTVWDGTVATSFAGGTGTQDDPYQISNGKELAYLAKITNEDADGSVTRDKYFKLTADIVLNHAVLNDDYTLIGTPANVWHPIGDSNHKNFYGNFDGGKHRIYGAYILNSTDGYDGIFGYVSEAYIHDLCVVDGYIPSGASSGFIAGLINQNSTVSRCYASGRIDQGNWCGLIIGASTNTCVVDYCYSTGYMAKTGYCGGIIGFANQTDISHCFSILSIGTVIDCLGSCVGQLNDGKADYLYHDNSIFTSNAVGSSNRSTINWDNCKGLSSKEIHKPSFAELLGEPFEYVEGNYPWIPGMLRVGEYWGNGHQLTLDEVANGENCTISFYKNYDGTTFSGRIPSGDRIDLASGETVYVRVKLAENKLLALDDGMKVTNQTTGAAIPVNVLSDSLLTFQWPAAPVTVSAEFIDGAYCGKDEGGRNVMWQKVMLDETYFKLVFIGQGDIADFTDKNYSSRPWGRNGNLKELVFEDGVESTGDYTFYYANALETVSWGTLKHIGRAAFYRPYKLGVNTTIVFPSTIETIGPGAFEYGDEKGAINGIFDFSACSNLTEVGEVAFYGTSVTCILPPSVKASYKNSFKLTPYMVLPEGMTLFVNNTQMPDDGTKATINLTLSQPFTFQLKPDYYRLNLGEVSVEGCKLQFYTTMNTSYQLSNEVQAGMKAFHEDEDAKVYIKFTPASNAYLEKDGIRVVDAAGNNVPLKQETVTIFSFVMPNSDVTISAQFVECILAGIQGSVTWSVRDDGLWGEEGNSATPGTRKYKLVFSGTGPSVGVSSNGSAPWSKYNSIIGTVVYEEGITDAGDGSMKDLTNLYSVTFPSTMTLLGYGMFRNNKGLKYLKMPVLLSDNSDQSVFTSTAADLTVDFSECTQLTTIGNGKYNGFTGTALLNERITTIQKQAFISPNNPIKIYFVAPEDKTLFLNGVQSMVEPNEKGWIELTGYNQQNAYTVEWKEGYHNHISVGELTGESGTKLQFYKTCNGTTLSDQITAGNKLHDDMVGQTVYVKILFPSNCTFDDEGLKVINKATGQRVPVQMVSEDNCIYSFTFPDADVEIGCKTMFGGYCGDTNISAGKDVKWRLYDDGTFDDGSPAYKLVISGIGNMRSVNQPGYYSNRGKIKSIVVEDGVTSLGSRCFANITKVERISLGNTLAIIGSLAFESCGHESLKEPVVFPASITTINSEAFRYSGGTFDLTACTKITNPGSQVFYGFGNNNPNDSILMPSSIVYLYNTSTNAGYSPFWSTKAVVDLSRCTNLYLSTLQDLHDIGGRLILPSCLTKIPKNCITSCTADHVYIVVPEDKVLYYDGEELPEENGYADIKDRIDSSVEHSLEWKTAYRITTAELVGTDDCTVRYYTGYEDGGLDGEFLSGHKVLWDSMSANPTIYIQASSNDRTVFPENLNVTATIDGVSQTVEVEELKHNLFRFTLPAGAVKVSAKFSLGGYCGGWGINDGLNTRWEITADNRLVISGEGEVRGKGWINDKYPWRTVKAVEVCEGITSLPYLAFTLINCGDYYTPINSSAVITLPSTLESIEEECFHSSCVTIDMSKCTKLTTIGYHQFYCFAGDSVLLPVTIKTIDSDAFSFISEGRICYPVADSQVLFANGQQVKAVDGKADITTAIISAQLQEQVELSLHTGYFVSAAANSNGVLKVYADQALTQEIQAGFKAIRDDDNTPIYIKVTPNDTKILFKSGLAVKGKSGSIAVTQIDDEVFSFMMPAEPVEATAQFSTGGYCGTANVNNGRNLIWTLENGTLAFQKNIFAQGDDISMGNDAPWRTLGTSITEVDLNGVSSIGNSAFSSCSRLTGIVLPASPILTVGTNAFAKQMWIIVPSRSWNSYLAASGWSAYEERMAKDKETLALKDGQQWRTYYSKVGRMLPEGIKAYTITDVTEDEAIASEPLNYIPAHQAVLIENRQKTAGTIEATTSIQPNSQSDVPVCLLTTSETNLLQWLTEPTPVKVGQGYTLYKDEFVKVSTGTLPAGIAFLSAQGVAASRLSIFNAAGDDELTGVDVVKVNAESGEWYTVDGKKLSGRPTKKGLYVKDGQKVVIR